MKFLYSDTQDYVDPGYDFITDRNAPGRKRYWDDRYAHELMDAAPYDGLLVAMSAIKSIPGVHNNKDRYSLAEEQRFLRDGARRFLRFDGPKFGKKMLMGDCGAFSYAELDRPPYSPDDVVEFYSDGQFTHGCAPDHIIFDFRPENPPASEMDPAVIERYEITLTNAKEFRAVAEREDVLFEAMGPVQGWSPKSMAVAASSLEKMGYRYLAVGGLVPLRPEAIHACLRAIRAQIKPQTKLHLLGFAKAEHIQEFSAYGIASFDSTSPLIRAFKDEKANYYLPSRDGGLEYHAAIRIPQATENARLMQATKMGRYKAEDLQKRESRALEAIRGYDKGVVSLSTAVEVLSDYQKLLIPLDKDNEKYQRELDKSRNRIHKTLLAQPWKRCQCSICRDLGVEVIIFRSSNRNKRRGFHNLGVYHTHVQRTLGAVQ